MSEQQHTPGPWRVLAQTSRERYAINAGDYDIASVWNRNGLTQNKANAHLIAAALDLYTAIKDSMEYLEGTLGPCDPDCGCILHALRAALAKAEGR